MQYRLVRASAAAENHSAADSELEQDYFATKKLVYSLVYIYK